MRVSQITQAVALGERVATMTPVGRDGKPIPAKNGEPATLQYVGVESETYCLNREAAVRLNLVEQSSETDPDKASLRNKRVLAACAIVGWTGFEGDDDQDLPCTRENVIALFQDDHLWQQAWKKIHAHRDFFTASSPA